MRARQMLYISVAASLTLNLATGSTWAAVDPRDAAAEVDRLLTDEIVKVDAVARLADDATFLRRVTLDLIGENPTPEQITAFALDPTPAKRTLAVERLLADPHFGQNWGRYWRDVILARRLDDQALFLSANSITVYMTDQHNRAGSWDQIARQFITAMGDARQHGSTGLIIAQQGKAEETAAEVCRVFLGIQIQCAQCHDHPYDDWTREQFHQLAAFFPRAAIRPKLNATMRTFEVVSIDRARFNGFGGGARTRGTLEHYMPNLDDPQAKGTLTEPVFFLNDQQLASGRSDAERRETLARWITDPQNEWFAKAYVNRLWSELVGRGFYEPVDDLGPGRDCVAPQTLDYLAGAFVDSGHNPKWLFRAITATQAYQRQSRSRGQQADAPLRANCPQPLRADQLLNTLTAALGLGEPTTRGNYRNAGGGFNSIRGQFNQAFGYDPSVSRDEVSASISQALMLMNSPQINQAIRGNLRSTALGKLLAEISDDEMLITELYLRCLAREPRDGELKTCLEHIGTAGDRVEAFEDILWTLINTAEFRHRT